MQNLRTFGSGSKTFPNTVKIAIRSTAETRPVNWVVPPAVACIIDLDIDAEAGKQLKNPPNKLHIP